MLPNFYFISILSGLTPCLFNSSTAPDKSFEPIKSLNLETIIQNLSSFVVVNCLQMFSLYLLLKISEYIIGVKLEYKFIPSHLLPL